MELFVLGLSHKTAPIDVRERLAVPERELPRALEALGEVAELAERMFFTTCNRAEVYGVAEGPLAEAVKATRESLERYRHLDRSALAGALYTYDGAHAVRHVFRVASSLDSMVMGEPQILGQVKDAYRQCVASKASGVILNRLLHQAFRVAKRVRTETAIAQNAVSVSFAAVELAKKILGHLQGRTILLIGAGEMSELAARHLIRHGAERIIVANRTYARAVRLAEEFHGFPVDFEHLEEKLQEVDIVISSTGAAGYVITREMIQAALRRRKNRLLFLIDIAVPRDIDPAAGGVDNVYLHNIDDLQAVVDENIRGRLGEAEKAERIIDDEVVKFSEWLNTLEVVPTIVSLREKAEAIMKDELEKTLAGMRHLADGEKKNIEILASSIVKKILHDPITGLKEESQNGSAIPFVAVMRRLFKLDPK